MKKFFSKFYAQILAVIVVSVIFGFISGVLGELWLDSFLSIGVPDEQKIQTLSQRLDELTAKQDKKLKDILSEKDLSVYSTIESIRPAIVDFYAFRRKSNSYDDILLENDARGVGAIMTADGWILTDKSVLGLSGEKVAVSFDKKVYSIEETICDSGTTACFVKIDAKDLPVVNLISREYLSSGQTALVISGNNILPTNIERLYYSPSEKKSDLIHSSEIHYQEIKLIDTLDKKWLGAPLVNLDGQVFGIVASENTAVAIDDIQMVVKQAVSEKKIVRPVLGVHFIDLSESVGWDKYADVKNGALIFGSDLLPAVLAQSPAQKAGLFSGDIIISIEGETITSSDTLTKLVQSYKPGQEIVMKILRGTESIEKTVILE
jgi:serine protease Do